MPRLLHTSDWHLGASLEGVPREAEQARFLAWLLDTMARREVEVLVVAGDVFDSAQPSAEALRLYYGFLGEARRVPGLRKVVIVGGNHDSAARLDAPAEVLGFLDVHVVGGLPPHRDAWARAVCPVRGAAGTVETVVLAVPFVHEYRLGVRTALRDEAAIAASFRAAFADLYTTLTDRALEAGGGAPIVATGHLATGRYQRGDAPEAIHLVGTIGALPVEVFDPRIQYLALGHIHRSYPVAGGRGWYPGSPVPLSIDEARSERRVLLVDVGGEAPRVEPIEVPLARPLVELRGPLDEVEDRLRALTWTTELPPLVGVTLEVERYVADVDARLRALAAEVAEPGPRLLWIRHERRALTAAAGGSVAAGPRPSELLPEEVFRLLCQARGEPVDDELRRAFAELLQAPADEDDPEARS